MTFSKYLKCVQVGENSHDSREPVDLAYIEKLKDFHFEPEGGIDQKKNQVDNLGQVDHCVDIVVALDESDAPLLSRHDGHWTLRKRKDM